jgi:hypothetical protein
MLTRSHKYVPPIPAFSFLGGHYFVFRLPIVAIMLTCCYRYVPTISAFPFWADVSLFFTCLHFALCYLVSQKKYLPNQLFPFGRYTSYICVCFASVLHLLCVCFASVLHLFCVCFVSVLRLFCACFEYQSAPISIFA